MLCKCVCVNYHWQHHHEEKEMLRSQQGANIRMLCVIQHAAHFGDETGLSSFKNKPFVWVSCFLLFFFFLQKLEEGHRGCF